MKKAQYKMPTTRKQQFADVVKHDFSFVLQTSVFTSLFFLPALVLFFIAYMLLIGVTPTAESVSPVVFWTAVASVPLVAICYLGKGAAVGVMQKRAFNQGSVVKQEFFRRIKENGRRFVSCGLIVGLSLGVALYGSYVALVLPLQSVSKGLLVGLLLMQNLVVYVSAEYFCQLQNMYSLSFGGCFKNGVIFCFSKFIYSVACYAVKIGVLVACALLSAWVALAVCAMYALFNGYFTLAQTLFACNLFDVYINAQNFPDYVKRGLAKD